MPNSRPIQSEPLNEFTGLVGMQAGGKRRILVRPERGWFKGQVGRKDGPGDGV